MDVKVEIIDVENAELPMLADVMARMVWHMHAPNGATSVRVYCNKRDQGGWAEYLAQIEYAGGGKLTIGCIQRNVGGTTEFHT